MLCPQLAILLYSFLFKYFTICSKIMSYHNKLADQKSNLDRSAAGKTRVEMDYPELSLGPSLSSFHSSSADPCRKRKNTTTTTTSWNMPITSQSGIELHLNIDPLPFDWEQCLDLQSGKMYYINRKTLMKSWTRPKEQNLDLELNISTHPSSSEFGITTPAVLSLPTSADHLNEQQHDYYMNNNYSSGGGNMVAVACVNCHLLVMLCKSSPSCPNCRYVQPMMPKPKTMEEVQAKPLMETLSLLH